MAKKKKSPLEAALEFVPAEKVLMGLKSAIPEPEKKPSVIGKIIKAPFKLVGTLLRVVTSPVRAIVRAVGRGLRRSS